MLSEFEVKGEAVTGPSGVNRESEDGKLDYTLVFDGPMVERWAAHLTRAIPKRGRRNWMNACTEEDLERFKRSFLRHAVAYLRGETDEDHVAAMFFNLNGAEYVRGRLAQDSSAESPYEISLREFYEKQERRRPQRVGSMFEGVLADPRRIA